MFQFRLIRIMLRAINKQVKWTEVTSTPHAHTHTATCNTVCDAALCCYETTRQTSSMQNGDRQVGHGQRQLSHISGWFWSWRLANHRPMHSRHHIGRQWQLRHADIVSVSSAHRRDSLMHATACMQPTHWSSSCTHSLTLHCVSKKQDTRLLSVTSPTANQKFSKFFQW